MQGQPACSYYISYGLCKYGPTCKFDHPLPGYPYNYGLSYPTVFHPPLYPYQSKSPVVLSSETSFSKSSKVLDRIRKPKAESNGKNQNAMLEPQIIHQNSLVLHIMRRQTLRNFLRTNLINVISCLLGLFVTSILLPKICQTKHLMTFASDPPFTCGYVKWDGLFWGIMDEGKLGVLEGSFCGE